MGNFEFGGEFRVKTSNADLISLRGKLDIDSAGRSVDAVTNQDASIDRTSMLKPVTADITLADRNNDYQALMKARGNWTFIEEDTGVTHYFTNAFLSGEPSVNRMTGEVTGLVLNCSAKSYSKNKD